MMFVHRFAQVEWKDIPDWERFLYTLSAMGFNFCPADFIWRNERTGAAVSDEALRDLFNLYPTLIDEFLRLWREGAKTLAVSTTTENGSLVIRVIRVE